MKTSGFFSFITWIAIAIILIIRATSIAALSETRLTVSAAISLSDALTEIKSLYRQNHQHITITYNFGASGALQQQIQQGAPVDVFISAASKQMNALQEKKLLIPETRKNLLSNRLVLIAPKNAPNLSSFRDFTQPSVKRIAIGEPRSVPAGQYAQELLENLKIFDQLKQKLVYSKNVRQVLTYVETGNVDAGIVYTTDAKQSNQVRVVATAPSSLHSPIVYPVAVIKRSRNALAAREFVQFLSSSRAKAVFNKYGFIIAR